MARTGIDRLFEEHWTLCKRRRVALLTNPTAVDSALVALSDRMAARQDVDLVALFGPEHGIHGVEQDMIAVERESDPRLNLPVYSLYGSTAESLTPPAGSLDTADVLVFDIQDIGSRYYTYIYTMMLAMEAAASAGVHVVVLDRPNPIGGEAVEGNIVHQGYDSFVGMHPTCTRHGMTTGELAQLFKAERNIDVELSVVPLETWTRDRWYDQTGLNWVMPSPNMPTLQTATVYPGMCLIEGTNLSEGRGTTRPFELVGAPYVDASALAERLNAEDLPGVAFRATHFKPTFQKHKESVCGGVQLHVTDRDAFRSLRTGLALIAAVRALFPNDFDWRAEAYEFVHDRLAIDLLLGTPQIRLALEAGANAQELEELMEPDRACFLERRQPHLLYPSSEPNRGLK